MADYTRPQEMSDTELSNRFEQVWHKAVGNFKLEAEASMLLNEINRRQLDQINKINREQVERESVANRKISRISLYLSMFAILFAGLSVTFSFIDWRGDLNWQKDQIQELQKISQILKDVNKGH